MAPRLSVVFQRLVRLGSFPACWRQTSVTPIKKGPPSSSVANCRPISITSILSKTLRCLTSACCQFVLNDLWNAVMCFQPSSLLIGRVWVPAMHFCACPIHFKVHWRVGRTGIVQIDFSAAFDRVNHRCILYKLSTVGIGACVVYIDAVSIKQITARYGGRLSE